MMRPEAEGGGGIPLPPIDASQWVSSRSPDFWGRINKAFPQFRDGNKINLRAINWPQQLIPKIKDLYREFEAANSPQNKRGGFLQLIQLASDVALAKNSEKQRDIQVKTQAAQQTIRRIAQDFEESNPAITRQTQKLQGKFVSSKYKRNKLKQNRKKQKELNQKHSQGLITQEEYERQYRKIQDQLDDINNDLHEQYVAQAQDVMELMQTFRNNVTYQTKLNRLLQAIELNDQQLQNPMPISYKPSHGWKRLNAFKEENPKPTIDNYPYPERRKVRPVRDAYRTQSWQTVKADPKLHTLPHQAPQFLRRVLMDSDEKLLNNRKHNFMFQQAFGKIAQKENVELATLLTNQAYWKTHQVPAGFYFDQDQGIMTILPQNPAVANLWPQGIAYKLVPTAKQINNQIKFLNQSHQTAAQMKQAYDQDIVQMMKGAQALGFNPHFGAISKNSPSLYIGAFVDPLTGMIRLPPKPQLKNYNPVDRDSLLQFKVLRAMYTWNTNVKAMQQMKAFMNQTQRGWNQALRNKRKNANVLQRQRKQYRGIARKIALSQPIYGYPASNDVYKAMSRVYQDKNSTPQQIIKATNGFMADASLKYKNDTTAKMANFPRVKVPLGDMSRSRNAYLFPQKPVLDSKRWLDRTLKISQPLGKTKFRVQNESIYAPLAQRQFQRIQAQMSVAKRGGFFNTLPNMRSQPNYNSFNTQNYLYTANVPKWHQTYSNLPTDDAIIRTKRLFGQFDQNNIKRVNQYDSLPDKINNYETRKWQDRVNKLQTVIGTATMTQKDILTFLEQQSYSTQQKALFKKMMDDYKEGVETLPEATVLKLLGITYLPVRLKTAWALSHMQNQSFGGSQFLKQFILLANNSGGNTDSIASRTRRQNKIYSINPNQQPAIISNQQLATLPRRRIRRA